MMKFSPLRTIVLAMGNDILGDDAVGLLAARRLRKEIDEEVDIVESSEAGFALMELMEGYDRALILDSIKTGRHSPGTVVEFKTADFRRVIAPSPHYAGLPEILDMASRLGISFPKDIRILAMEVDDPFRISEEISVAVRVNLPDFVERASRIMESWGCSKTCADFY
jgi:hydrogenase maturation protease